MTRSLSSRLGRACRELRAAGYDYDRRKDVRFFHDCGDRGARRGASMGGRCTHVAQTRHFSHADQTKIEAKTRRVARHAPTWPTK